MTGRAASGRPGLRARGALMLAVPMALIALAVAAFALAPTGISRRANDRTDERLLPPVSRASVPALAFHVLVAVVGAAVFGGEGALSWPRRAVGRWRVEW